jgi:DNA-binding NarL/FixJ family response regulator
MQPLSTFRSLGDVKLGAACGKDTRRILIVEDDDATARSLECIAANFGNTTVEATVGGALHQVVENPIWDAFIVDIGLRDGSGLDVVSCVRADDRDAAVLILTGRSEHRSINAAFDLRAQYLDKPATCTQIEAFLASAMQPRLGPNLSPDERPAELAAPGGLIDERLASLANSYNFTTLDVDVVHACLHGYSGKEYVEHRKLSVNTYKRRVRRLLRKLGASSVGEVRDRLLRSV